jgi:uncharacterized protein YneF (UPF0154 family)
MMDWNTLINSAITGLFVGLGSTIGAWIAARYFLKNLEKVEEKLKCLK